MNAPCTALLLFASAAFAQTRSPNELTVWFADGTAIEIHSESTGANWPLSRGGSETITPGYDAHRLVTDKQGKILLGYDIDARKDGPGTFTIRMKPVDRQQFQVFSWNTEEKVPTITGIREFPRLRVGDAVQIDILLHPVTGERIYDVLKVLPDRLPSVVAAKAAAERPPAHTFSLVFVRIVENGRTVREPQGWQMSCNAFMIHLPGRGDYYLTASPSKDLPLQASGWAEQNILRFAAGGALVEIVSRTKVLQKADNGTIWVYHDPESGAREAEIERLRQRLAEARTRFNANHPDVKALQKRLADEDRPVEFTAGDSVEQLLALLKRKGN